MSKAGSSIVVKKALSFLFSSKPFQKRLAKFLVHPVTILALATVAAAWLTNYYQTQAWMREKRFEMFRQDYTEALRLVDEVSELMSRRFFGLNRVMWVAKGSGTGELDAVWDEYYDSVVEWNTKLLAYQGRLARSIEPKAAVAFGAWEDAARNPSKGSVRSIHGHFFVAHEHVRDLVDCVRNGCSAEAKLTTLRRAEETLSELGTAMEAFIEACTGSIHDQVGAS